jgi:LytS/YehU family sensor histidine kinase
VVAVAALGASLITGLVWAAAVRIWASALDDGSGTGVSAAGIDTVLPVLAAVGALVYMVSLAGHYLLIAFDVARAAERNALESAVAAREAELKALKAQIQPHFLFNSLNSVSALTATDPAAARDMAIRLADFLRTVLSVADKGSIPLRQELSLVEHYLAIEQVRLGSRLTTLIDVPADALDVPILPLTLQPLVENAVKHGLGGLTEGGEVAVRARIRGGSLEITVTNPFDPGRGVTRGTGSGLEIVRRRLAAAYGREGTLSATAAAGVHAATITMPAQT